MSAELAHYIHDQLNTGFTRKEIIDHLRRHGYSFTEANSAFDAATRSERFNARHLLEIFSLLGLVAFVFWIGISSQSDAMSVIVAFLPSIISVIAIIAMTEIGSYYKYFWAAPIAISAVFYIVGVFNAPYLQGMELGKVSLLNVIISYIFAVVLYYPQEFEKEDRQIDIRAVGTQVQSVEDKCKALNSAIGRVYRMSNGATDGMREKIRISSEIYNALHKALTENDHFEISQNLFKIDKALENLRKTEKEVLGDEYSKIKNIAHDFKGGSKILDVLAQNDNDPVLTYYEGAVEAVNEMKKQLLRL